MNNDRTILHRDPLPEMAGGRLVIIHELTEITGAAIREDHQAAAIRVVTSTGDRAVLGMSPGMIDALMETLRKVRAQMTEHGVEHTIPLAPVHTVQCGLHQTDGTTFVAMIVDRSLPSAAGYLMPPKNARAVAKQLIASAREASHARGEIIGLDEV